MKKIKEILNLIRILVKSENYMIVGITQSKTDPELVDLTYRFHAHIPTMVECIIEIVKIEQGKQEALEQAQQILKS